MQAGDRRLNVRVMKWSKLNLPMDAGSEPSIVGVEKEA